MGNRAILYSGGVLSLIAWVTAPEGSKAYYVDYTGRFRREKYEGAIRTGVPFKTLVSHYGVEMIQGVEELEEPAGLGLHLVNMAAWAGADSIVYPTAPGTYYTPSGFYVAASSALTYSFGRKIRVLNPFEGMTRAEIIQLYLERTSGGEKAARRILETHSCAGFPGAFPCGTCAKCTERRRAFKEAGIVTAEDPTRRERGTLRN